MKQIALVAVAVTLVSISSAALAQQAPARDGVRDGGGVPPAPPSEVSVVKPVAGVDYPTDIPLPQGLVGKSILVISDRVRIQGGAARIAVASAAVVEKARLGGESLFGRAEPKWRGSVLVFPDGTRIPLVVEPSRGGVLVFPNEVELVVTEISSIEKARAGIDFPTDGPPGLDRSFYVAVSSRDSRERVRVTRASRTR